MKAIDFKNKYLTYALNTQAKTGIDAYVVLAQCALESGWGEHTPGNMMFGVKDWDGVNGNEQLIKTFEYSRRFGLTARQIGLHEILTIEPTLVNGVQFYKYTGTAYFRKYDSPEESFNDHCHVFFGNKAFAPALAAKHNPELFIKLMAPIYAQSPTYADTVISLMHTIKNAK